MRNILFAVIVLSSISAHSSIKLAITVDDLPTHGPLPIDTSRLAIAQKFVLTFKQNKIEKVYGFINARRIAEEAVLSKVLDVWTEAGHLLGNHTYSHHGLVAATVDAYEKEIDLNEPTLKKYSPNDNWHYFRYPYLQEGDTLDKRNKIRDYLASKNYKVAEVTADFEDWAWNDPYARCLAKKDTAGIAWLKKTYIDTAVTNLKRSVATADKLFKRPVAQVLLLHIGAFDAEMLGTLIQKYQEAGVEFITLEEASKDPVYALNPQSISKDGADYFEQIETPVKRVPQSNQPQMAKKAPSLMSQLENLCK